nr:hypothetical transcript [Hymenolepis microstoma]
MSLPQVVRCEDCLRDLQGNVCFEEELRGSRSFKVVKVRCDKVTNRPRKVIKIYQIYKADISIELARNSLFPFSRKVDGGFNLLPVETFMTDKYAFISRDFVDQSLAERIGTRPFLTFDEKRWITFQLLLAVQQLHSMKTNDLRPLCHGDIKPQNVLLTSWGWVLLTDPAPFKPTQLPSDNPSVFTHVFDSSRHRSCYLAPERFMDPRNTHIRATGDVAGGDCDCGGDGYSSVPGNLNLKGETSENDNDDCQVIIGEVADESLELSGDEDVIFKHHKNSSMASDIPVARHISPNSRNLSGGNQTHHHSRLTSGSMPNVMEVSFMSDSNDRPLLPSMDLFSVGCVLLELFTDGTVPFKLSDMLHYRRNQNEEISKLLESVSDDDARALIEKMISLKPEERGTAAQHLNNHRGGLFPNFFFTHLQPFFQSFLDPATANPAVRLRYVRQSFPKLLSDLQKEPPSVRGSVSLVLNTLITSSLHQLKFHRTDPVCTAYADQSLNIFTSNTPIINTPVTAPPPFSPLADPHEDGLICLLTMVQSLPSLPLFNRLWPNLIDLITNNASHEFRYLALDALVQSLEDAVSFIENLPPVYHDHSGSGGQDGDVDAVIDDIRFLNEFLLPSLSSLANDDKAEMSVAMAQCLPRLIAACEKILCLVSKQAYLKGVAQEEEEGNTEKKVDQADAHHLFLLADSLLETDKVRDWLQHRLVPLLSDNCPDNFARRTLFHNPKDLAKITTFLGQKLTIDVILGHLTTFLNAKDVNVRAAFFDQVPTLVSLCGEQSVPLLQPLLESGLADGNEIILSACLRSLVTLQRDGLLEPLIAMEFIPRVLNLTAHPLTHIQECCIAYITALARPALKDLTNPKLSPLNDLTIEAQFNEKEDPDVFLGLSLFSQGMMGLADLHATLGTPEIRETYFKSPIGDAFSNDAVLLAALHQSLAPGSLENVQARATPRQLCDELLKHLRERQLIRHSMRKSEHPWYPIPPNDIIAEVLKRLQALDITDQTEDQLLLLTPQLESLSSLASDPRASGTFLSRISGGKSNRTAATATAFRVRVESKNSGQVDLPGLRLFCLPSKPFIGVRMMKCQPFSSPGLNIDIRQPFRNATRSKSPTSSDTLFTSAAYPEVIAARISEGEFALPSNLPPPNVLFSRSLSLLDDAASLTPNDFGLSIYSCGTNGGTNSRIPFTGYLLRGDVSKTPSWVPNPRSSVPRRLRHLVHLQEHKAGHLSLALHPLEHRFVSCSSGDGLLKIWELGHSIHDRQQHFENEEESVLVSSDIDPRCSSCNDNNTPEDNTPATGTFIPSRSLSTYAVQPAPLSGEDRPSCKYLVWTDGGSCVATLANRSSINLIDMTVGCQRACFPVKINEIGSPIYLTNPSASSYSNSSDSLQAYSYCGTDRNLVIYSTAGGRIVGQDVRSYEPAWILNLGFDYGLVTCLAVHSGHTWLTAGTHRAKLINWDLRFKCPISEFELPKVDNFSVSFTKLKIYDVDARSTLICAATNHLNEVVLFDLQEAQPGQSCKRQVTATLSHNIGVNRGVKGLLVLPHSTQSKDKDGVKPLPNLVTGGDDYRLRYWNLNSPEESAVLAWEGVECRPRPRVTFVEKLKDNLKFVREYEEYPVPRRTPRQQSSQPQKSTLQPTVPEMSSYVRLEMGEVTLGHTNIISDLISLTSDGDYNFLVSAAMNGAIKIWK